MNAVEQLTRDVIRLLISPDEQWDFGEHTATHRRTKIVVWIANGKRHVGIHRPTRVAPTRRDRAALWNAVEWARCWSIQRIINNAQQGQKEKS